MLSMKINSGTCTIHVCIHSDHTEETGGLGEVDKASRKCHFEAGVPEAQGVHVVQKVCGYG